MTYYIVNDFDRPCPMLVAQLVKGRLYYINRELLRLYREGLSLEEATPLEDFGFEIHEYRTADTTYVGFLQTKESVAIYKSDKANRPWQGEQFFVLEKIKSSEIPVQDSEERQPI